jgi:hypothetical protein
LWPGIVIPVLLPVVVSMNLVIASVMLDGPAPQQLSCCLFLADPLLLVRPIGAPSRLDSSSEVDMECELVPNRVPSCSAARRSLVKSPAID